MKEFEASTCHANNTYLMSCLKQALIARHYIFYRHNQIAICIIYQTDVRTINQQRADWLSYPACTLLSDNNCLKFNDSQRNISKIGKMKSKFRRVFKFSVSHRLLKGYLVIHRDGNVPVQTLHNKANKLQVVRTMLVSKVDLRSRKHNKLENSASKLLQRTTTYYDLVIMCCILCLYVYSSTTKSTLRNIELKAGAHRPPTTCFQI